MAGTPRRQPLKKRTRQAWQNPHNPVPPVKVARRKQPIVKWGPGGGRRRGVRQGGQAVTAGRQAQLSFGLWAGMRSAGPRPIRSIDLIALP
jgi:hypothetical protein